MTVDAEAIATLDARVTQPSRSPVEPAGSTGDPATFSLCDAIAFAMQNSPRLRMAAAAVNRANGQETVAFAPFLPEFDLYTRYGASSPNLSPGAPGPVGGILAFGDGVHEFLQAEVGLQWTVWDFGRTSGRYGQAVSRQRITELQLARARQTIVFDVTTAYLDVLLAQATRREQQAAITLAEAILRDARVRREGGVADRDDVLRAEVQLAETRETLVVARELEFNSLARLNYSMGRNPSLPLNVIDRNDQPVFECSLVECLQSAVAQRQEVQMAQEAVASTQYGLQTARAEFLPRIFVIAGAGNVAGDNIRTGWQEGAGIRMDKKLYAGGKLRGEEQIARADVHAAIAGAESVFDSITLEVNLAYRRLNAARERIPLTETAVIQARENMRLVRLKYQNGNASPTDVVDAETTANRTQRRYDWARYDALKAIAQLEYSMGTADGRLLRPCPTDDGSCDRVLGPELIVQP